MIVSHCPISFFDPPAFIGMVLAFDQDRLWSPADGLAGVDRHDRDGILVVLHIFRGEMGGKLEDFPGVAIIAVEVEGLVDGPALCLDAGRFPAQGIDAADSLIDTGIVSARWLPDVPASPEKILCIKNDKILLFHVLLIRVG